jgi:predicted nucleic acid-binding protein
LKIIVDSDIFISHIRREDQRVLLEQFARRSTWYMSSVVAMELRVGCRTRADVRLFRKLLAPFERTQRVIYPDHRMWVRAGAILGDIGSLHAIERTKRKTLANDALIALSAVSIGAAVVTSNALDFELLARAIPLTWFGGVNEAMAAMG